MTEVPPAAAVRALTMLTQMVEPGSHTTGAGPSVAGFHPATRVSATLPAGRGSIRKAAHLPPALEEVFSYAEINGSIEAASSGAMARSTWTQLETDATLAVPPPG